MTAPELIAPASPAEARDLTDRIKVVIGGAWELIKQAYESRAWAALGYPSWDDYCSAEFGASRLRLPMEERQEVVASLRASGLSIRAIAAATGTGTRTVQADLRSGVVADHTSSLPPAADPAPSSAVDPASGEQGPGVSSLRPAPNPATDTEEEEDMGVMDDLRAAAKAHPVTKITGTDGKQYPDKSRAAVQDRVAKAKAMAAEGYTSRQIAAELGLDLKAFPEFRKRHGVEVPADAVVGKTRHLDHNRIVSETTGALEGLAMGIGLVGNPADAGLDPTQIEAWATSLRSSLTVLTQFSKQLKEMTQ